MLNGMLICLQATVSHLNTVPSSLSHLSLVQRRLLQQLCYVHVCHLLVRRPVRMQGPERRHRGPLRGELLRLHRVKVNVERGQSQLDLGLVGYICNLKEGRQGAHVAPYVVRVGAKELKGVIHGGGTIVLAPLAGKGRLLLGRLLQSAMIGEGSRNRNR